MKLIKTDKNGTKYYVGDCRCTHCGGLGGADQWAYTGWTCYRCGGSGLDPHPEIIKEYTPEYEAKLNARREKRQAEKLAKRLAEFNEHFDDKLADMGFGINRKIYVVKGNTYPIRTKLKELGAIYTSGINWFFSKPNEQYDTYELDYTECLYINYEYGTIEWDIEKALNKIYELQTETSEVENNSDYIGEEGQKVTVDAMLDHVGWYHINSFRGYGEDTVYIYSFVDSKGNVLVWKTTKGLSIEDGDKVIITGTIKEHSEYKGVKQTVLQRCKITLVEDGE